MPYNNLDEPQVSEVMREDVVFADEDSEVSEAANVMKENGIGSLVVGDKNTVKGIVTTKDIVYKHVAGDVGGRIKDIMTRDLVTISPRKTVEDAALIMVKKNIERLPVMEGDEIIGIISTNNIISIQPALYLDILKGLKLGEERFERVSTETEIGQCESCDNYSEDLQEVGGEMVCPECREEML